MGTSSSPLAPQLRHSTDWGRRVHRASSTASLRTAVAASRDAMLALPGGCRHLSSVTTPGPFLHRRRQRLCRGWDRHLCLKARGSGLPCKGEPRSRAQVVSLSEGTTRWNQCPRSLANSRCLRTGGRCHRTPQPGRVGASGVTTTLRRATNACRMQTSVLRTPVPGGGQPTQIHECAEGGSQKRRMAGAPPAMNGRLKRGWVAEDLDSD